jgi:ABC-type transport system involved in multi-copper enzyme maturation permease subunit
VCWAWLAVIISLYSVMLGSASARPSSFQAWQWVIAGLFCASLAMSAAGSFRRERESGVMELLLVTPLTVGQIVNGRLRGIWSQFLPALLLFVVVQFFVVSIARWNPWNSGVSTEGALLLWLLGSAMLTLPVIGLYFSLRCRLHITAVVAALVVGVALPAAATWVMGLINSLTLGLERPLLFQWAFPVALMVFIWVSVRRREMRPLLLVSGVTWLVMLGVLPVVLRLDDGLSAGWPAITANGSLPQTIVAAVFYALLQTACALWLGSKLHHNLEHRRFALPQ